MVVPPSDLDNRLVLPDRYGGFGAPHHAWEWLRRNDPVHWTEPDAMNPFWSITRHADVMEISVQPEVFSNAVGGVVVTNRGAPKSVRARVVSRARPFVPGSVRRRIRPPGDSFRPIVQMDPPHHREFRRVTAAYFSPAGIAGLAEIVARVTSHVMTELAASDGPVDAVEALAHRQPLLVLAEMLGLDPDQTAEVLTLTTAHYEGEFGENGIGAAEERTRWIGLIDHIAADRRRFPKDDLSTLIVSAEVNGKPIGQSELRGYFLILFTAGHDTTGHSLTGALDAFLNSPSEFERLRGDKSLVASAVEEIVRFTTPVNYMKRTVMRPYDLSGVRLEKGDELALFYGSACRDEQVFAEPQRFDVGRSPNRHLGFGWAVHHCLGAHLARSSLNAFLRELRVRVVSMERAGTPTYTPASFVTGHKKLPVTFNWAD